jgi:hypothetical protein
MPRENRRKEDLDSKPHLPPISIRSELRILKIETKGVLRGNRYTAIVFRNIAVLFLVCCSGESASNSGSKSQRKGWSGPFWKPMRSDQRFRVGALFMVVPLATSVLSEDLALVPRH